MLNLGWNNDSDKLQIAVKIPHGRGARMVIVELSPQLLVSMAASIQHLVNEPGPRGHAFWHWKNPELSMPCSECKVDPAMAEESAVDESIRLAHVLGVDLDNDYDLVARVRELGTAVTSMAWGHPSPTLTPEHEKQLTTAIQAWSPSHGETRLDEEAAIVEGVLERAMQAEAVAALLDQTRRVLARNDKGAKYNLVSRVKHLIMLLEAYRIERRPCPHCGHGQLPLDGQQHVCAGCNAVVSWNGPTMAGTTPQADAATESCPSPDHHHADCPDARRQGDDPCP
jgi:hypothetical protein